VLRNCGRRETDPPARIEESLAEILLLIVEEKSRIKRPGIEERFPSHEKACTTDHLGFLLLVMGIELTEPGDHRGSGQEFAEPPGRPACHTEEMTSQLNKCW
jgi:hypothetical protein